MRAFLLKANAILISLVWSAENAQQQQSERPLINSPVEGLAGAPHPATLRPTPPRKPSALAQASGKPVGCLYPVCSHPTRPGRKVCGRGKVASLITLSPDYFLVWTLLTQRSSTCPSAQGWALRAEAERS